MNFINKMNFIRTDVKNKLKNGKKNLKRIWNLWNFKIENHKEDFEYFYFFKWKYFFFIVIWWTMLRWIQYISIIRSNIIIKKTFLLIKDIKNNDY